MIKIPNVTFVFFFGTVIRWSYRLSWQRPGMVSNPTSCSQCLSHWISHWRSNMNEKISHHLRSPVYWLCFLTHVSFRHAALGYRCQQSPNTSKILGVSIPNCACVTKHKTNICCRRKTKHWGPFQRLVGHFHTGSLSAGGQRCQSPALPLSPSLLSFLFSCISHVIFEWSLVDWFS